MSIGPDPWRPANIASCDLAAGLKAARELQQLPVPSWLAKQLSNYALKAERELEARAGKDQHHAR